MTPTQSYELARMFAARIRELSEKSARIAFQIAQPQEDSPAGERKLRDWQREYVQIESALEEACHIESQVRRVLGLEQGGKHGDQDN